VSDRCASLCSCDRCHVCSVRSMWSSLSRHVLIWDISIALAKAFDSETDDIASYVELHISACLLVHEMLASILWLLLLQQILTLT